MTERGRCSARTLSRPSRRFLRLQRMRFRTRPWPLPLPPLMRTRTRHAIKSATSSCTQALTFPTASSIATARPSLIWLRIIRNSTQFWVRMSLPNYSGRTIYGASSDINQAVASGLPNITGTLIGNAGTTYAWLSIVSNGSFTGLKGEGTITRGFRPDLQISDRELCWSTNKL